MNLEALLSEHNIPFRRVGEHHHATANWLQIDCPFCSSGSNKFRMGLKNSAANCWQCGFKSAADVLTELLGVSFGQAKALLGEVETEELLFVRPKGTLTLPPGVGPMLQIHRDYLRGRGFDPQHIESFWGVQGIGLAANLSWRLFIPIHLNGEVVSWTTRSVMDCAERRYVNASLAQESVSPKTFLYGLDHARHAVIAVEGCTDVWKIGPGAVATMGVGFTADQVRCLARYPKRVICFDNEPAAQRRAYSLVQQLGCFDGETLQVTLDAKDAGSASERELKLLRRFLR